jgi:NDP-sugar pyrophosphorylase family protein
MDQQLSGAIIAAGKGERLRDAADGMPKPLVRLGNETLLERQVRLLTAVGAHPLNAIINSETARLIHAAKLQLQPELAIMVRDTPNSMESLLALGERIPPGRFLLVTVDAVLAASELSRFVKDALVQMDTVAVDGVLGVVTWRGDKHPLFAEVADDGKLTRLGGKESRVVTAGVYLFSTRIFEFAAEARSVGLDALRRYLGFLLEKGMDLAVVELTDIVDVDEGADLRAAQALADHS